jgi:glutamine synthetase
MATLALASLFEQIEAGLIDTVLVVVPDHFGRLAGKRVTGHHFKNSVAEHGTHLCDYLLACDIEMDPVPGYAFASWQQGYGDVHAVCDMGTLRVVPWLEKSALVFCDLHRDDKPVAVAPRQILRTQIERARALGLRPLAASELEFYLFRESYRQAATQHFHDLTPYNWYIEDYQLLPGTRAEPFIRAVRNAMDGAGVPIECSKGEWGPGQQEINFCYADMLEMADRHTLYKHGVKELASQHDVSATFMAKWDERFAGSGCHLHVSLWDQAQETNRLFDARAERGMSPLFASFLAGQLAHARELTLCFAPFVNSYKRFIQGSFAPTRIAWGFDNRTVGFRVVGLGQSLRVENRIPGADSNIYLAFAATLAAGLDGIERALPLGPSHRGDAYQAETITALPQTLDEAIACFAESALAAQAFGPEVTAHYLHAARNEVRRHQAVVTCFERHRHFERT